MANQQNSYTVSQGTGTGNRDFSYTFPTFTEGEVKVEIDNVVKTLTTHYTIVNHNSTSGGTVRFNTTGLPGSTAGTIPVRIFRQTDVDNPKAEFTAGSSLKAGELNDNFKQLRHALQEAIGALATDRKVQRFNIEADAIDGTLIADDVINSEHYAAGSIDLEHMSANSVDSDQYVDGSIDLVHMSANSVDSDQYVDGSIDRIHLEADIIDSTKLADDSVDSEHLVADSIDTEHYAPGSIDANALASNSVTEHKIANTNVTEGKLAPNSVVTSKINNGAVNTDKLADLAVNEDKLANNAVTTNKISNDAVTIDKIADAAIVTNSEQASHTADDNTFFTTAAAEAAFLRQDSSETIASGVTWSATDTKVATSAAIDLRIIELVDNVGGFVPIANETSFPTENPDINTSGSAKGGTIVSVQTASTALTAQSGTTLTIANGRGTGNAVIITGVSATIPQGYGFLVETTATDHTYAFHRLVPKATEVATVAANAVNISAAGANVVDINNFADLYQISTSAPTNRADSSSLQIGDLWFDSSSNKVLMIYDGSAGDGFTAATPNASDLVNINIVAGHLVYQEDLGLITNAVNTGSGNNSVNTVAASIANVNTVAADLNESTSEIDTVATNITNVNNVGNSISNVNTVAGSISNVNAVAGNATNINNVAADATDIGAVAGKATEIGRLGTADAVADLAILGTTDVVADLNTLATTAIVSDMDTLADISSNITTVAGISSNVTAVAGNATNINAVQGNASNINAVAGNNTNISAVANNSANINSAVSNATNINSVVSNATNINTVAGSIADVNRYAAEYVIQSGTPSSPSAGDLWYNTTSNVLNYYSGSTFVGISPGIAGVINDANPALANHLDCNDKNLTEVGTVSGNNLQIDFGTI